MKGDNSICSVYNKRDINLNSQNMKTEEEIIAAWSIDFSTPLVSIFCITYNHECYIEDAIKGFLNQETEFPFEVLIHDDASTDNTASIIQSYVNSYPNIIKPIYQNENQYSKNVKINAIFNLPRAQGKFIAFCEGDDYWIDKKKLSIQVRHLLYNDECSLSFHATKVIFDDKSKVDSFQKIEGLKQPTEISLKEFISGNGLNIRTVGMVVKKEVLNNLPDFYYSSKIGDLPIQLLSGIYGNYLYIPRTMAVYRRAIPGSWSEKHKTLKWKKDHISVLNNIYEEFNIYTDYKYNDLIMERNKKWTINVILRAQSDFLSRREQILLLFPYIPMLVKPNKSNVKIWTKFILGKKGIVLTRNIKGVITKNSHIR